MHEQPEKANPANPLSLPEAYAERLRQSSGNTPGALVAATLDPKLHPDGHTRNQSVAGVLKHFRYAHLPPQLQDVSRACAHLAYEMANTLPENADLVHALRELLAAKDGFVRAALHE